ncbi:MAG: CPBP family intramembrane glutamic endopeptidase [Chlorobiaceae bacterium]
MKPVKAYSSGSESLKERLTLSFGLMATIWILGLLGHLTSLQEWPALLLYVLGSIGIVLWRGKNNDEWAKMFIAGGYLRKSLLYGGIAGGVLFIMDITNTVLYYTNGGKPMAGMEFILIHGSFLYLFPLLILAEEFFWRGIMFSAMIERGFNKHFTVLLTTVFYSFNHFAVAPVSFEERALMVMMAFPIGILGGYIVLRTKNIWGSFLLHLITMISMVLDIFVIPQLIR